jgi:hypothetical protein
LSSFGKYKSCRISQSWFTTAPIFSLSTKPTRFNQISPFIHSVTSVYLCRPKLFKTYNMQSLTMLLAGVSGLALTHAAPLIARDICGAAPSGPTGATPLAEPSGITTPAACEAACKADTSCEAFVCGYVTSAPVCILYAVPASSIPPQSNSNLLAYDLACSSVPTGTLSATNPTGANDPTGVPASVSNPAGTIAGSGRMA